MPLTPAQKQATAAALQQSADEQAAAHEVAMILEAAISERAQRLVADALHARRKARAAGGEIPPPLVWADALKLAAKQLSPQSPSTSGEAVVAAEAAAPAPKSTRQPKPAPAAPADASTTENPA